MFITNKEKVWIVDAILNLQQEVKEIRETFRQDLEEQIERNNRLKEYAIKKKHRVEELEDSIKTAVEESVDIFKVFDATFPPEEAPWGYKKDGTPRKRPGRPIRFVKVGQP